MRPFGQNSENLSVPARARASAISAAALVVGAVAIALLLVATTADDSGSSSSQAEPTTAPTTGSDGDASGDLANDSVPESTDGTAEVETGDNANVSVQVANSTSVGGAAAKITDSLKTQGYIILNPTNATTGALATTKIHYSPGMLLEARAVAGYLAIDPETTVFTMPNDPASEVTEYLDPLILVIIGSDLAN